MSTLTDFNPPFLPFSAVREVYVETGVCEGNSLINAINAERFPCGGFTSLHGIELLDRHLQTCKSVLFEHGCLLSDRNSGPSLMFNRDLNHRQFIELIPGSSIRGGLERAIGGRDGPIRNHFTFFLDAHGPGYHDDEWEQSDGQCPILKELDIVLSYEWLVNPLLIIDDCNSFASEIWWSEHGSAYDRKQWPVFSDIYDRLHQKFDIHIEKYDDGGRLWAW